MEMLAEILLRLILGTIIGVFVGAPVFVCCLVVNLIRGNALGESLVASWRAGSGTFLAIVEHSG